MLDQQLERKNKPVVTTRVTNPGAAASGRGVLAAAVAIAGGTQAYAEIIVFQNPDGAGHFDWAELQGQNNRWLDVTLDANSQTGAASATRFHHVLSGGSGLVQTDGSGLAYAEVNGYLLTSVTAGTFIPSGYPWATSGYAYYAGYGTVMPEGAPTYVGVKFDLGSGFHYGWIGVVRSGAQLDAFAWGYETEVGVAIPAGKIPTPGTLALLAFGALGAGSRKRKGTSST